MRNIKADTVFKKLFTPRQVNPGEVLTIHTGVKITRRKSYIIVMGKTEDPLYVTQSASKLFEWIQAHKIEKIVVDTGETSYTISCHHVTKTKD